MKKYKLIKEYPGSPELGTIVTVESTSGQIVQDRWCYRITTSPEFWEEVIEKVVKKDYDIITIINDNGTLACYEEGCPGSYSNPLKELYETKEHFLRCFLQYTKIWRIHSIKRLSDGEIFTIGDKIERHQRKGIYIIENIFINMSNNIRFSGKGIHSDLSVFQYGLSALKHISKPLFTTKDGVDMYEGDRYWMVYDNYKFSDVPWVANKNDNYSNNIADQYFSSREIAKQYCFENKPTVSLKDIKHLVTIDTWEKIRGKLEYIAHKKF